MTCGMIRDDLFVCASHGVLLQVWPQHLFIVRHPIVFQQSASTTVTNQPNIAEQMTIKIYASTYQHSYDYTFPRRVPVTDETPLQVTD